MKVLARAYKNAKCFLLEECDYRIYTCLSVVFAELAFIWTKCTVDTAWFFTLLSFGVMLNMLILGSIALCTDNSVLSFIFQVFIKAFYVILFIVGFSHYTSLTIILTLILMGSIHTLTKIETLRDYCGGFNKILIALFKNKVFHTLSLILTIFGPGIAFITTFAMLTNVNIITKVLVGIFYFALIPVFNFLEDYIYVYDITDFLSIIDTFFDVKDDVLEPLYDNLYKYLVNTCEHATYTCFTVIATEIAFLWLKFPLSTALFFTIILLLVVLNIFVFGLIKGKYYDTDFGDSAHKLLLVILALLLAIGLKENAILCGILLAILVVTIYVSRRIKNFQELGVGIFRKDSVIFITQIIITLAPYLALIIIFAMLPGVATIFKILLGILYILMIPICNYLDEKFDICDIVDLLIWF